MSRNIGYIMRNGAGNRSQHQLCLQSEARKSWLFFYHSYKLTLLSNNAEGDCGEVMLCSHTKLHYFQTASFKNCFQLKLCTHTKLHYSQTLHNVMHIRLPLCTPTKLHYSQTSIGSPVFLSTLCTTTKLHYSQTSNI